MYVVVLGQRPWNGIASPHFNFSWALFRLASQSMPQLHSLKHFIELGIKYQGATGEFACKMIFTATRCETAGWTKSIGCHNELTLISPTLCFFSLLDLVLRLRKMDYWKIGSGNQWGCWMRLIRFLFKGENSLENQVSLLVQDCDTSLSPGGIRGTGNIFISC